MAPVPKSTFIAYVEVMGSGGVSDTHSLKGWQMRRVMVVLLSGLLAVTVGCSAAVSSPAAPAEPAGAAAVTQLDPADFAEQMPNRLTINVHIPDEGSLPDTDLALPYDQISARQSELPADRSTGIAIYCMTGHMSTIAGRTLSELGYTDIIELRGGMAAWRAAGQPFLPAG